MNSLKPNFIDFFKLWMHVKLGKIQKLSFQNGFTHTCYLHYSKYLRPAENWIMYPFPTF